MRIDKRVVLLLLAAGCGPGLEETLRPDASAVDAPVPTGEARPPDGPPPDRGPPTDKPWVCRESYATNYDHVAQGRAHRCGANNFYACANGSDEQMGLWNTYDSCWLKETGPGFFRLGRCP